MTAKHLGKTTWGQLAVLVTMFGVAACSPPERTSSLQITVHVRDENGQATSGIRVRARYPSSTDLVEAISDEKGNCTLMSKGHPLRADISIYLSRDDSTVGHLVVAVPEEASKIHRDAEIGSYVEYGEDGQVVKMRVH
jgi:hypothetical protein